MEINFDTVALVKPSLDYMDSYKSSIREYRLMRVEDFAYPRVDSLREAKAYLKKLDDYRAGRNLPNGFVPSSGFWLVDGKNYLGSGDIRHFLNDGLRVFGGNIGYSIRPEAWGKGLGTIQLRLLLAEAGKLYIDTPRITCFDENIGSAKVIEKNGGILVDKVVNRISGKDRLTRIYEIYLINEKNNGII